MRRMGGVAVRLHVILVLWKPGGWENYWAVQSGHCETRTVLLDPVANRSMIPRVASWGHIDTEPTTLHRDWGFSEQSVGCHLVESGSVHRRFGGAHLLDT
jgi:hypothetical protein